MSTPDPDPFFTQTKCDRCPNDLKVRTLSYFNEETICMECKDKETEIKELYRTAGVNPSTLEGCGYIPNPRAVNPSRVLFK
jgi:hypothetical protein